MAKRLATAEEIRAEIQRRIEASDEMDSDCRNCGAPTPVPLRVPDQGCNWTILSYPKMIPGWDGVVRKILAEVMREYDLAV